MLQFTNTVELKQSRFNEFHRYLTANLSMETISHIVFNLLLWLGHTESKNEVVLAIRYIDFHFLNIFCTMHMGIWNLITQCIKFYTNSTLYWNVENNNNVYVTHPFPPLCIVGSLLIGSFYLTFKHISVLFTKHVNLFSGKFLRQKYTVLRNWKISFKMIGCKKALKSIKSGNPLKST